PDVTFTYESSDTTIATISPGGQVALLDTGTVTFTARAGDVAGSVTTVVGPRRVIRLSLARPAPWLLVGGADTLGVATYGYGDTLLTGREVTYLSYYPSVLTVDSLGVMRAHAPGVGEVWVRSGLGSATLRIAVLPEEPVELVVAPSRRVIAPRELARTGAQLRGASGALMSNAALYATYESSDPDVAFLGLDGTRVHANSPGVAEVRIRAGHLVGTATFVVEEATADGLAMDIIPVGATPEAVTAAAQRAARRWARVVKGGPMPQPLTLPDSACGARTPALDRTVDGIAIFLQTEKIDGPGGTLAMAGPCALRGYGDHFPVVGVVSVDADDVALAAQYGLMEDLLMHEIGHVLGIGTLWDLPEVRALVSEGADPRFTGAAARDAALRFGFLDAAARGVPVEVEGGEGTAGAHWRESLFGSELMTGWLDPGSNVLGAFTLGALADLGYEVHEAEVADLIGLPRLDAARLDWRDPAPVARRERHPAHRVRMADRLIRPHLQVDRQGRATPVEGRARR
ncbi:MAG TPA: leishmanolysin-related zinc metalloendopeptidase, partial [Gemmatimonadaceae bacterium]|nr:leishmanolysin-related zinc metalloendopeptidase [Gemmatimonadaceae bacterium]